jgi:hypothetical protein
MQELNVVPIVHRLVHAVSQVALELDAIIVGRVAIDGYGEVNVNLVP